MSTLNTDELLVGTAREVGLYVGALTAVDPANLEAPFATGWTGLGYASEDGASLSNSTDTTDLMSWQSTSPLRTIITGRTVTLQFQLMQITPLNIALYWDIETPTATNGVFDFSVKSSEAGQRRKLAVDVQDGDNQKRYIFPRVQLTAAGDMSFSRGSATLLDVTFTALEHQGELVHGWAKVGGAVVGEEFSF